MLHIASARVLILWVAAGFTAGSAAAQETRAPVAVDLALVLAVDVSNSVDDGENAVQRAGYVAALRHPAFWAAIHIGARQRIAITYVEWAGPDKQAVVLPWRLVDGPAAARSFAEDLATRPIFFTRGTGTSISAALLYSAALFRSSPFTGAREVIDISGDGPNNRGGPVEAARDAVLAEGVTINGLPIMVRPSRTFGEVDRYYRECVIGGLGAFVMPVFQRGQLALAIRHKLVLEIAGRPHRGAVPAQARVPIDCLIGERLRNL